MPACTHLSGVAARQAGSHFTILHGDSWCADDGFISAKDLELSMGRGADVKQMIAAADKNGDGKV